MKRMPPGRRTVLFLASCATFLAGCAGALPKAIDAANLLGEAASAGSARVEASFQRADRGCVWAAPGLPLPNSPEEKEACAKRARAAYGEALGAYDAFYASWDALKEAVHVYEVATLMGRVPDDVNLLQLLSSGMTAYSKFQAAKAKIVSVIGGAP